MMRPRRARTGILALSLAVVLAGPMVAVAASPTPAQWDLASRSYHTHLIVHSDRFELHVHDMATHAIVDTTRGTYEATLRSGGRTVKVPLRSTQRGILVGVPAPSGDWQLSFRIGAVGRPVERLVYSPGMKGGSDPQRSGEPTKQAQDPHAHH